MSDKRPKVILLTDNPLNAQALISSLRKPITPTENFYIRNHFYLPQLDVSRWRLRIGGEVLHPLELSLTDLLRFPPYTATVTLECAGNGRTMMSPVPVGVPWGVGAVSTASFTGVLLQKLLGLAGIKNEAMEVLFEGADSGEIKPGRTESFARSLSLDDISLSKPFLAWAMNDEPLSVAHGYPLRLVVPGWYGMASVKWLTKISVLSERFEGFFQKEQYRYVGDPALSDETPVTLMRVRSIITYPEEDEIIPYGPFEIKGIAWSGQAPIARVEVSVDGARSFVEAELGINLSSNSATPWRFWFQPQYPGKYTVIARAFDKNGDSQPLQPIWNQGGFGNNVVHSVKFTVE